MRATVFPGIRRLLWHRCRAVAALAPLITAITSVQADTLFDQPLEQLLDTEVVSATRFAREITDAASALSVLTADDIRNHGWRTLAEILDHMRGLHMNHTLEYPFLGVRGIGGPGTFAGRVLLLINGVPTNDNIFEQIYLGHDALIDVAMIDRIEYAPGGGSAMYGHNAFLGVVNIVTRPGRDLDGAELAVMGGSKAERQARLSLGKRFDEGGEWLASLTVHRNDGMPMREAGTLLEGSKAKSHQFALIGKWRGFGVQWLSARRSVGFDNRGFVSNTADANDLFALSYDVEPAEDWRSSLRAYGGKYRYRFTPFEPFYYHGGFDGAWWSLDTQTAYTGMKGHRWVVGLRWRRDPRIQAWNDPPDDSIAPAYLGTTTRESLGISVEDEIALGAGWTATLGLRAERRLGANPGLLVLEQGVPVDPDLKAAQPQRMRTLFSPRVALVGTPLPGWTVKLSRGISSRLPSPGIEQFEFDQSATERLRSDEAITEYRYGSTRWLGSLYHFRLQRPFSTSGTGAELIHGRGIELEGEYQWQGWRLRASQAWQRTKANTEDSLVYSPHTVTKLMASVPLDGERVRGSISVRRTSPYKGAVDADFNFGKVPSRTIVDLTLVARKLLGPLNLTIGLRDALDRKYHAMRPYQPADQDARGTRHVWIELSGVLR
ncbi:TonB-dependent receptor [Chitinivorax sp. B]|uniref:TonB-dependent receptor plug domain-containing protein n=1 Tax=Chitinivorax sp. B TaxID=2502235 RepID=UPI0010F5D748|nr:TonB-dependent receptor [Chitinivorax sp. B]